MPRRRMLDPSFFDDTDIAKLTRDERLFLLGCIRNADDDGRLNGHPAYLKAEIFMYDDDIDLEKIRQLKDSTLEKMETWQQDNLWQLVPYHNADHDYLYFPRWSQQQKPSHPTPSKLPVPPSLETQPKAPSGGIHEELTKASGVTPPQSSLGQSSLVKVSIVKEDFTKFLDSEKDLTDLMTTTLTEYMPRGPIHIMPVIQKLWLQATGKKMSREVFQVVYSSLQKYPIPVLAKSLVKAVKYSPGKTKPANYILTVFDKQMKEYEKERSP